LAESSVFLVNSDCPRSEGFGAQDAQRSRGKKVGKGPNNSLLPVARIVAVDAGDPD
jgi:hypothetical protein